MLITWPRQKILIQIERYYQREKVVKKLKFECDYQVLITSIFIETILYDRNFIF